MGVHLLGFNFWMFTPAATVINWTFVIEPENLFLEKGSQSTSSTINVFVVTLLNYFNQHSSSSWRKLNAVVFERCKTHGKIFMSEKQQTSLIFFGKLDSVV